ncbi:MAG: CARDB domain-containing protein, partial [Candidatus Poseidoniaceae archaeon]
MQGKKSVLLLAIFLSSLCYSPSVSAEEIDGIAANSVNILPSQPIEGGSITIQLGLQNTNSEEKRVEYAIYRDQISPSFRLVKNVVEVCANCLVEVNTTWSGLTAGEKTIWVEFGIENGLLADFSQSFTVQSLPDLEVTSVTFEPESGVKSGEQVNFSATISNGGEFDADSSQVRLLVDQQSIFVSVPQITSQNSVVVEGSFVAPSSGQWDLLFTADVEDDIVESDENNDFEIQYTVDSRVDFYHVGGLSVIAVNESLTGPWVYSGLLGMANGVGDYNVTLQLSATTAGGAVITSPPFVVGISAAVKSWEHTVTISDFNLPVGVHEPEVMINPFGTDEYI